MKKQILATLLTLFALAFVVSCGFQTSTTTVSTTPPAPTTPTQSTTASQPLSPALTTTSKIISRDPVPLAPLKNGNGTFPAIRYYARSEFDALVIGESTVYDLTKIAPCVMVESTDFGFLYEYPSVDGGTIFVMVAMDDTVSQIGTSSTAPSDSFYGGGTPLTVALPDATKSAFSLVTRRYSAQELESIQNANVTFAELNALYPAECVRVEDGMLLSVIYLGQNELLQLYFLPNGNPYGTPKVYPLSCDKATLDTLTVGVSLDTVKALDPQSYVPLENSDLQRSVYYSFRYTSDGYFVKIAYNSEWKIIHVDSRLF